MTSGFEGQPNSTHMSANFVGISRRPALRPPRTLRPFVASLTRFEPLQKRSVSCFGRSGHQQLRYGARRCVAYVRPAAPALANGHALVAALPPRSFDELSAASIAAFRRLPTSDPTRLNRQDWKRQSMSALGHKRTYAVQQPMSATAKAAFRKRSCPLYFQKRTCAE